jgi:hypothetical protein
MATNMWQRKLNKLLRYKDESRSRSQASRREPKPELRTCLMSLPEGYVTSTFLLQWLALAPNASHIPVTSYVTVRRGGTVTTPASHPRSHSSNVGLPDTVLPRFVTNYAQTIQQYHKLHNYVGVLISLWLSLFHLLVVGSTTKRIFLGLVKQVRTTKSQVCGVRGRGEYVNTFFQPRSMLISLYTQRLISPLVELPSRDVQQRQR